MAEETTITPPKQRAARKPKKPVQEWTAEQIAAALCALFRLLSLLFRSSAEFDPAEFKPAAKLCLDVIPRFPLLGLVFRILQPLAILAEFRDKIARLLQGRRKKDVAADADARPAGNV